MEILFKLFQASTDPLLLARNFLGLKNEINKDMIYICVLLISIALIIVVACVIINNTSDGTAKMASTKGMRTQSGESGGTESDPPSINRQPPVTPLASAISTTVEAYIEIINSSGLPASCEFEVLPILYIISEQCAIKNEFNQIGKDAITNEILTSFRENYFDALDNESKLKSRIDFYSQFINEKPARCDYLFKSPSDNTGIMSMLYALGDVLFNPHIVNNYDEAPVLIKNFDEAIAFSSTFQNRIIPIFLSYSKYIEHILTAKSVKQEGNQWVNIY